MDGLVMCRLEMGAAAEGKRKLRHGVVTAREFTCAFT